MPPDPAGDIQGADRQEVILLVEDDDLIRDLVGFYLKARGYALLIAEDGPRAIELLAERTGCRLDLLLVDLHLPGLDGLDLAQQVLASYPDARLLIMSGAATAPLLPPALVARGTGFLHKPFKPAELERCVRAALDG